MRWEVNADLERWTFIALGSNLGDCAGILAESMGILQTFSDEPLLKSSLWQSTPVDCPPGSPLFLNAVVGLSPRPGETAETLLSQLQAIEKRFGRRQKQVMNEARPLDLDLISFGRETRATPKLTLPHPRAHLRKFVLQPLAEIAPDLVLPGRRRTVSELLQALTSHEVVRKLM